MENICSAVNATEEMGQKEGCFKGVCYELISSPETSEEYSSNRARWEYDLIADRRKTSLRPPEARKQKQQAEIRFPVNLPTKNREIQKIFCPTRKSRREKK